MSEPIDPAAIPSGRRPDAGPPIRWWPAALILALAALAIVYVRFLGERSHQERNILSMIIGVGTTWLLLLWVLFLSRLRWRVRGLVFGGVVGLIALLAAMFEVHGVTGDIRPVFRFRWQRPPELAGVLAPGPASATSRTSLPVSIAALTNSYPQFLGPHRDATIPEGPRLARDWIAHPPQTIWRQPIGPAWSGYAVAGQRAITQEQRANEELVVCYELATGRVLWTHGDPARYATTIAGEGPRATPTIVMDRVLTLGATGLLNCLDLATGQVIWRKDVVTENQGRPREWGMAGSPLVMGDLVILNPGGKNGRSLVAYRLDTGGYVWGGGEDEASYSSPCAGRIGGLSQVVIFNQHAVFGHDPATGQVLWQYPWPSGHPHVAQPLLLPGDRILVSSGYGTGSELVWVARDETGNFHAQRLWKTTRLKAKFNNPVARDGFVYGLDDGVLVCIDLATGAQKWKEGRYGHGQFILVGDVLLLGAENGEVVLLDPSPAGRRELTKFAALKGKTWNPPALAGDILLVRNDREAACYRLPVAR